MPCVNKPPGRWDSIVHRVTTIWFPRFAIECWRRRVDRRGKAPAGDLPVALARDGPHGPVVHAANGAAEQAGVRKGGRVADMRALCPGLLVEQADIGADVKALERLMLWARRWCPWTTVDGTAGIVMDTTGSDHLWGGEAAMLRDIEERLTGLGFSCRLAAAPTHGAAWALSRLGDARDICTYEDLAARTDRLEAEAFQNHYRLRVQPHGAASGPIAPLVRAWGLRMTAGRAPFVELAVASGFSFLRGAKAIFRSGGKAGRRRWNRRRRLRRQRQARHGGQRGTGPGPTSLSSGAGRATLQTPRRGGARHWLKDVKERQRTAPEPAVSYAMS